MTFRFWPWLVAAVAVQAAALTMFMGKPATLPWPETAAVAPRTPSLSALDVIESVHTDLKRPQASASVPVDRFDFTNLGPISDPRQVQWSEPGDFLVTRPAEMPPSQVLLPRPNPHPENVGEIAVVSESRPDMDDAAPRSSAAETAPAEDAPALASFQSASPPLSEPQVAVTSEEETKETVDKNPTAELVAQARPAASTRSPQAPASPVDNDRALVSEPAAPDWLAASMGKGFAIQLAAFADRSSALEFVEKKGLGGGDKLLVMATQSRGRRWHIVILGPFSGKSAAAAAAAEISAQHTTMKPWIRSIRSIADTRVE